jgi:hypothetical protein
MAERDKESRRFGDFHSDVRGLLLEQLAFICGFSYTVTGLPGLMSAKQSCTDNGPGFQASSSCKEDA